jgi:hypothetical protein
MLETAPTPFEKTVAHVALIALAIQTHEVIKRKPQGEVGDKLEAGLLEAFAMSQEPAEA